jgi:hypothetical protein
VSGIQLPKGTLLKDRRYFIHDEYAGLSAFVNKPDEESDRAARMLAVGILVPLEHGRMGRSWRHAETLKELARYICKMPIHMGTSERKQGTDQRSYKHNRT